MEVGVYRHDPASVPPETRHDIHRTGGRVDPWAAVDGCRKSLVYGHLVTGPFIPYIFIHIHTFIYLCYNNFIIYNICIINSSIIWFHFNSVYRSSFYYFKIVLPSLVLCMYFIRTSFSVLVVLHFALLTTHNTNIHVPGGIRTRNLSRREATDLRPRPRWHGVCSACVLSCIYPASDNTATIDAG